MTNVVAGYILSYSTGPFLGISALTQFPANNSVVAPWLCLLCRI